MGKQYAIGLDFGTESGRAVLVDLSNGDVVATSVQHYADGVIETCLPGLEIELGADWALQNPNDYINVFVQTVRNVLKETKEHVSPHDIVGLGIDFTSSSVLPVKQDGTPLCHIPSLRDRPHSWVKLWKHHAAQDEASRLNEIAAACSDTILPRYGGKISSEWLFPKLWQILNEDPDTYAETDRFIEATDWMVWQLTGREVRSSSSAGYKALWHKQDGFPSADFFKRMDPRLEHVVAEKLGHDFLPVGSKAGGLTAVMAEKVGLPAGVPVAVGNVDAHVSAPAAGVVDPGVMLLIMGTSTCNIVLSEQEQMVPGISGVVEDGVIPGFYGYEAGQPATGDLFAWFIRNGVTDDYVREADLQGISLHTLLEEKASRLSVGESGLLALDWLNGNRSVLNDADLSGLILGMTLDTKPEHIYRALIEATAFGQRLIIERFIEYGVPVDQFVACGGLPHRNQMLMQIYADVIGNEIAVSDHRQTSAVGAAMFGAVAAGKEAGGYDTITEAARHMAKTKSKTIKPIAANVAQYDTLYRSYRQLHHYFGHDASDVMHTLKAMKKQKRGMA